MKTVTMIFEETKTVDGVVFAEAGQEVEVAEASVERWLKRGGKVVEEPTKAVEAKEESDDKEEETEESAKTAKNSKPATGNKSTRR